LTKEKDMHRLEGDNVNWCNFSGGQLGTAQEP
jgi:hypothetical protein